MARARFLVDRAVSQGNLWSAPATTISASSAALALPAAASQNPDRRYAWRSDPATGTAYLRIDLGSSLAFDFIALANVKLVGAGAVKLQELGTGGSPGSAVDVVTLPAQDADRQITYAFFATQTKRHVQLLFTNPTAADDYAEVGYVALGSYFEPGINFQVPAAFPWMDPSTARVAEGGQKSFIQRDPYGRGDLHFQDLLEADFDALQSICQIVRITTPFFLVLDTTRAWMNGLVRLTGVERAHTEAPGRVSLSLGWEEAL